MKVIIKLQPESHPNSSVRILHHQKTFLHKFHEQSFVGFKKLLNVHVEDFETVHKSLKKQNKITGLMSWNFKIIKTVYKCKTIKGLKYLI